MTRKAFILSIATTALVFAIASSFDPEPDGLPAPVAARLVEHRVLSVVDSQTVKRQQLEIDRLKKANIRLNGLVRAVDSAGMLAHFRADTLQAIAIAALTAADSARAWELAHANRKVEAEQAWASSALKDTIIAGKDSQLVRKDSVFSAEKARRIRADSLVAKLEPLAARRCRILLGIPCPTRGQAYAGGVITALAAVLFVSR